MDFLDKDNYIEQWLLDNALEAFENEYLRDYLYMHSASLHFLKPTQPCQHCLFEQQDRRDYRKR